MASRKHSFSVAESSAISSQKVRRLSRATFDRENKVPHYNEVGQASFLDDWLNI